MALEVRHGPALGEHNKRCDAQVRVGGWPWRDGYPRWVELRFCTGGDKNGSSYTVYVSSKNFKEIVQAMMQANPQEAIKAFGAAMQEVPEIALPSRESPVAA
jgi:hypothetical protein